MSGADGNRPAVQVNRIVFMPQPLRWLLLVICLLPLAACGSGPQQCGRASWTQLTSRTASGEYADPSTMTAAHRTLPFGSRVKVTNLGNGRSTVVRINDRGPYSGGRIIDVSRAAADRLGFRNQGVARVKLEAVSGAKLSGGGC